MTNSTSVRYAVTTTLCSKSTEIRSVILVLSSGPGDASQPSLSLWLPYTPPAVGVTAKCDSTNTSTTRIFVFAHTCDANTAVFSLHYLRYVFIWPVWWPCRCGRILGRMAKRHLEAEGLLVINKAWNQVLEVSLPTPET